MVGARLGPYEILAPLGAGGMGEVYRARDGRLQRDVAIKVLSPEFAGDAERLRRFEQEARAASALNHPNVLSVYDLGTEAGRAYLVTELLTGETLRDRLRHGALPARRAVEVAAQLASGLAAAHGRGIVHRDLKPENLFLTTDGHLKILDFGLARLAPLATSNSVMATAPTVASTEPGMLLGTVGYMSPEQVRGEAADFRSDLFSFGLVLHEMLTGERAFQRPTGADTLHAILHDEPPALPAPKAASDWLLQRIVERCLAKDPGERYAATRDLAGDLSALGASWSETARAPGGLSTAARRPTGTRALLFAAAGILALVTAGLATRGCRSSTPPALIAVRAITYSGRDTSPAASPDGQLVAFRSIRDGRGRIWIKQLATGTEIPLTAGDDDFPRFSPDGTLVLYVHSEGGRRSSIFRVPALGGTPRRIVADASRADWSPDGRQIAFTRVVSRGDSFDNVVGIVSAEGGEERELQRFTDRAAGHVRWSPDGATLALPQGGLLAGQTVGVQLIEVRTGQVRALGSPGLGTLSSVGWIGRGDAVVYARAESVSGNQTASSSRVFLHRLDAPHPREILWLADGALTLDVAASGRLLLDARSPRQNLNEIELDDGAGSTTGRWLTRGSSTDRQPVYTPDGGWIVFSGHRAGNLDLWAVAPASGEVRRLTEDAAQDWDPYVTRQGKLLWSSNRGGYFAVWTAEADGSNARQVTRESHDAENPTATPDGEWIVYSSGDPRRLGIYKIRPDGSDDTLLLSGSLILPEVSPDGRYFSYVDDWLGGDTAVRVAEVSTGAVASWGARAPVPHRQGFGIVTGRSRWMPDGRRLAFIALDRDGSLAIFEQEFIPGRDTAPTRRRLAGFGAHMSTESFAVSPDGRRLVVAAWEQLYNIVLAEPVPGIEPPRPGG